MKYRYLPPACAAAAQMLLIAGSIEKGAWGLGMLALVFGALWFIRPRKRPAWMTSVLFLANLGLIGYGAARHFSTLLMIASVCFLIAAWETSRLSIPLEDNPLSQNSRQSIRIQLIFLGISLAGGALLSICGLLVSISVPFFVEFLSAGVVLLCLYQFVNLVTRQ
jgi:hypothetical protein